MKSFKFFQKVQKLLTMDSWVTLRDIHNRKKHQYIQWSQYPSTIDAGDYQIFEGNILQFYDYIKSYNRTITPIVYEIGMWRSGYFTRTYTISNERRMNNFISRSWKLRIHYNI